MPLLIKHPQEELYEQFIHAAHNHPFLDVKAAASNLLANACSVQAESCSDAKLLLQTCIDFMHQKIEQNFAQRASKEEIIRRSTM